MIIIVYIIITYEIINKYEKQTLFNFIKKALC